MTAFVGHLLTSPTIDVASRKTGISPRTASRWLHSEEFTREYVRQREASLQNLAHMLRSSSVGAVEALADIIRDPKAPSTAKSNAARSILSSLLQITEQSELEERLKRLEASIADDEERD